MHIIHVAFEPYENMNSMTSPNLRCHLILITTCLHETVPATPLSFLLFLPTILPSSLLRRPWGARHHAYIYLTSSQFLCSALTFSPQAPGLCWEGVAVLWTPFWVLGVLAIS